MARRSAAYAITANRRRYPRRDIEGQAAFWKQHYNTPFGAGTVSKYAYKVQKVFKEGVAH